MCPDDTPYDYSRLKRRQAEIVAGVSRATLYRKRDEGLISVTKDRNGQTVFDASELQRVFPDTFNLNRIESAADREKKHTPDASKRDNDLVSSIALEKRYLTNDRDRLTQENERLRRELAEERSKREVERAEFMRLIQQNQETVKQLTDQRPSVNLSNTKGFWARLLR
jgi:hypothetical protein